MRPEWQRAIKLGDAISLASMLADGERVDSLDRYGQTGLMVAAREGHEEVAKLLIAAGAELDHTAKYGLSALMLAVLNRRDSIADRLLRAGADTGIRGTGAPGFAGKTALDLADDLGRDAIARRLREEPGSEV